MGPEESRDPRLQREGLEERIDLKTLLAKHGLRPDKRFGQHFLVSQRVVRSIVDRVSDIAGVLEVGPGPGVLTRPMTDLGIQVVAVELDKFVLPLLLEFAPRAKVVEGDALTSDLESLLRALPEPRAIVSNMPYNITGPLLDAFTNLRGLVTKLVLMMQREVAEKILAPPGDSARGALSVVMQAHFVVSKVCQAPPGAFLPPPKVESTVLQFVPARTDLSADRIDAVIDVVRAGFTQPRKTVYNNLTTLLGRETADQRLTLAKVEHRMRPHQLTWEQWTKLSS